MQQFEIENHSFLPLKNISYYYLPNITLSNKSIFKNSTFLTPKRISNIPPLRKSTISIEQSLYLNEPINYESINLYIVIHYKYLCFCCKDSVNFISRKTSDNKFIWTVQ